MSLISKLLDVYNGTTEPDVVIDVWFNLSAGSNVGDVAYVLKSQGERYEVKQKLTKYYVWDGSEWISELDAIARASDKNDLSNRIVVNQTNVATTLGSTIDSDKEYFIDGEIDLSTYEIEIPIGGINITGYGYDVSKLYSSEDNYTMFTSPLGGSGGAVLKDFTICVEGVNSKVYNLVDNSGFNAVEVSGLNYDNCTSLGELDGYRQGLELNTGRFGGTPNLILSGTWLGGFRVSTSIVRNLDDVWSGSLFEEGTSLLMNSRFTTDINCDLGLNSSLFNFKPSNFNATSLVQLKNCIITRKGINNPDDPNITPNIQSSDLVSVWRDNQGIPNTYVGVRATVGTEVLTTISATSTFYSLEATWDDYDLEHFDVPLNGQWRNLGESPIDFKFHFALVLNGGANNEYRIRIRKYDDGLATTSTIAEQLRAVQNSAGGNDVAYFNILGSGTIKQNDYIFLEVSNETSTANCTLKTGSEIEIIER